ncbi:hypothetical protein [Yersinia enterocolitica]|uniref:hypothetical protein n=1 Tax=Yersinia enterocolitica TaxID=630 RepID=UPI00330A539D|nr:hypothetical protein [Yersinia enterocolitica]
MLSKPVVRTTTNATVTLTIEISNLGSWGPDCQTAQVYKQAIEAANGRLNKLFAGDKYVRILAGVKVTAITTAVERTR